MRNGGIVVYHNVFVEEYGPVTVDIESQTERGWASAQFINAGYAVQGGSLHHDFEHYSEQLESMDGRYVSGEIVGSPGGHYDGAVLEQQPLETNYETIQRQTEENELAFGEGPYEPWFS